MTEIEVRLAAKNSTKQFKEWMLKTSTLKGMENTVNSWPAHAANILVNAPNLLKHESFITQLTRALYHGNLAIEKRKEENVRKKQKLTFISEEEKHTFIKENISHAHIIDILQECCDHLKVLVPPTVERADMDRPANRQHGSGFTSPLLGCTEGVSSINIGENELIQLEDIDIQFDDIRCRFLYFFLDLIELEETVIRTWERVKNLEISLISATVVTHFAIQKVKRMDYQFSRHYPTHTNATTFFFGLKGFLSPTEYIWVSNHSTFQLLKIILEYYQHCSEELTTSFCSGYRLIREKQVPEQYYHNEYNGRPLTDNQADIKVFLDYEIMVLFNSLVSLKKEDDCWDETIFDRFNLPADHPSSPYMREFIRFFETTNISVPFLFLTLCWIRSVQCLEDSDRLFLYKTVYLYRSFIRQRNTNFKIHLAKYDGIIPFYEDNTGDLFEDFRSRREYCVDPERCFHPYFSWNTSRHHPFLVGMHFLEEVFHDHELCSTMLVDGFGYSQTIPLLYRSFRALGMMSKAIPFLEEFFDFMERSYQLRQPLFKRNLHPSKKDVHFTVLKILNYAKDPKDWSPPGYNKLIDESLEKMFWHPKDVSVLFSILVEKDVSLLKADSLFSEESFEELVQITERELLNGGYLSVDLFKYFIAFRAYFIFLKNAKTFRGNIVEPSPIKKWYDRDCPKKELNFCCWMQRTFLPFLADVFQHPKDHQTDVEMVKYFMRSMTGYFNDKMKCYKRFSPV
jgi:hypothetical protein